MADLNARELQQLAETLGRVISQQGQAQETEREKRSAAQRAADMRKADNRDKTMVSVLRRLGEQLNKRDKSLDDLTEMVKATKDANQRVMEAYGKNFERAQQAMVSALKESIEQSDELADALRNLAGDITDMRSVLQFQDVAKQLHEVSLRMDDARNHASSTAAWFNDLTELSDMLREQGKTFESVDKSLGEFDKLVDTFTEIVKDEHGNNVRRRRQGMDDDESIGKQIQAMLKTNQVSQQAQNRLQMLGQQAVTAAANTSAKALNNHASITNAAGQRVQQFAARVFTAANAVTMLEKAVQLLYTQTKTAYSTGTQKSFFDVLTRDMSSFMMGVDPNVVQQAQATAARNRNSEGRVDWDNRFFKAIDEMSKITGDRNEAAKANASLLQSMNRLNLSNETAYKNLHGLNNSFLQLQYLTGMTAEQFASLNESLLADGDFRRQMLSLNEKERAATLLNINRRMAENEQIGISIEQTKQQIDLFRKLYDPLDPKKRFKNQFKEQLFLQTQGLNPADSMAIANMNKVGAEKYQAQLANRIGEEAAAERVRYLVGERQRIAEQTQARLADDTNVGLSLVTQSLVDKTGMNPYTSDAFLRSKGLNDQGQAQFTKSVGNFQEAVNNFTGTILKVGDYIANLTKSVTGLVIGAAGILAAWRIGSKLLGHLGALGKFTGPGKGQAIGQALGSGFSTIKNFFTGGGAAATAAGLGGAAGTTGVATAAGIGSATGAATAAGTAAAGGGLLAALKGWGSKAAPLAGKAAKIGKASLPGLALGGAAALAGDETAIGKVLNSGTVTGAMLGGTLGSFVPVIGTGIGAGVGGLIGGAVDLWDYATSPGKPTPIEAKSPSSSRQFVTPVNNRTESKPVEAPAKDAQSANPNADVVALLKQQNDTLMKLLRAVVEQTSALNENSDKYVSEQKKLQRALRTGLQGGDSDLAASAKYN